MPDDCVICNSRLLMIFCVFSQAAKVMPKKLRREVAYPQKRNQEANKS